MPLLTLRYCVRANDVCTCSGALVKRVALQSKEALLVMAYFYDQVVAGGAEGSLYIFDQAGVVRDTRTKAHQSAITALICVGTQLWSGSDDGALHTWEMKVRGDVWVCASGDCVS